MHINSISKIEEAAEFISMMNKDITQHVGYCGKIMKKYWTLFFMVFLI